MPTVNTSFSSTGCACLHACTCDPAYGACLDHCYANANASHTTEVEAAA